jgi:hypothetical protein
MSAVRFFPVEYFQCPACPCIYLSSALPDPQRPAIGGAPARSGLWACENGNCRVRFVVTASWVGGASLERVEEKKP